MGQIYFSKARQFIFKCLRILISVSDRLPVFPDLRCEGYTTTESTPARLHSHSHQCGIQICCQPIIAENTLPDLSGIIICTYTYTFYYRFIIML